MNAKKRFCLILASVADERSIASTMPARSLRISVMSATSSAAPLPAARAERTGAAAGARGRAPPAGGGGEADGPRRERGGIVPPVARHADEAPAVLQFLHLAHLFL